MRTLKLYALTWLFVAAAALATFMTGSFNSVSLTVFGFVVSTLIFMGLVAVLPALTNEHYSRKIRA